MSESKELADRLKFIGIDTPVLARLRELKPVLMKYLPAGLDRFYQKIRNEAPLRAMFRDEAMMNGAKTRQSAHWDMISEGRFDQAYLAAVTKVGEIHARIGLAPRWYIGGYAMILEDLINGVLEARWRRAAGLAAGQAVKPRLRIWRPSPRRYFWIWTSPFPSISPRRSAAGWSRKPNPRWHRRR